MKKITLTLISLVVSFLICGMAFAQMQEEDEITKRHEDRMGRIMKAPPRHIDRNEAVAAAPTRSFEEDAIAWLANYLGVDVSQLDFADSVIMTRFDEDMNPEGPETKGALIMYNGFRYFVKGEFLSGDWSCAMLPQQWGFSGSAMVKMQLMDELGMQDEDLYYTNCTGMGITLITEGGEINYQDIFIYEVSFTDENGITHKRIADWGYNPGGDPWKILDVDKPFTYLSLFLSGFDPLVESVATINMTLLGETDNDTEVSILTYNGVTYYRYGVGHTNLAGEPNDWQDAFQSWTVTNLVHPFDVRIGAVEAKRTAMAQLDMTDEDLIYAGEGAASEIDVGGGLLVSQAGGYTHIFIFADRNDTSHLYYVTFYFDPTGMTWIQQGEIMEMRQEMDQGVDQFAQESSELDGIIAVNEAMQPPQVPEGVSVVGAMAGPDQQKKGQPRN